MDLLGVSDKIWSVDGHMTDCTTVQRFYVIVDNVDNKIGVVETDYTHSVSNETP